MSFTKEMLREKLTGSRRNRSEEAYKGQVQPGVWRRRPAPNQVMGTKEVYNLRQLEGKEGQGRTYVMGLPVYGGEARSVLH